MFLFVRTIITECRCIIIKDIGVCGIRYMIGKIVIGLTDKRRYNGESKKVMQRVAALLLVVFVEAVAAELLSSREMDAMVLDSEFKAINARRRAMRELGL